MSNDKGLLSGSITILIGAVIAIMAGVAADWGIHPLGALGRFDPPAPVYAASQTPPAAPTERTPATR